MKILIDIDKTHGEETARALRSAIMEIIGRSRLGLDAMGCHPCKWDDSHFDGVSRDMGYAKRLKILLTFIESGIEGGSDAD